MEEELDLEALQAAEGEGMVMWRALEKLVFRICFFRFKDDNLKTFV